MARLATKEDEVKANLELKIPRLYIDTKAELEPFDKDEVKRNLQRCKPYIPQIYHKRISKEWLNVFACKRLLSQLAFDDDKNMNKRHNRDYLFKCDVKKHPEKYCNYEWHAIKRHTDHLLNYGCPKERKAYTRAKRSMALSTELAEGTYVFAPDREGKIICSLKLPGVKTMKCCVIEVVKKEEAE